MIMTYANRSEQIAQAMSHDRQEREQHQAEPYSRDTSGLFLFLLQLCICLHLCAFAIY